MTKVISRRLMIFACVAGAVIGASTGFSSPPPEDNEDGAQSSQVAKTTLADGRGGRYTRSFQALNGTVYLLGSMKVIEGGRRWVLCDESDPPWSAGVLHGSRMNSFFSKKGLFIALEGTVLCTEDGTCTANMWRSQDDLKTISEERTSLIIPEAGKIRDLRGKWPSLIFHRGILELEDGSFLAAMYGNFEQDTAMVSERSEGEGGRKTRAFVVRSTDQGRTWRFLANVAVPDPKAKDDSEGFDEWHFIRLADRRLFGIIRTGHYTPMVAVWSSDNGRTWTKPKTLPGLGPAGDPYLLRLSDGRLALAYGDMVQPTEPKEEWWKKYKDRTLRRPWNGDPRNCKLALNQDGTGASWETSVIGDFGKRTGYPTVFEIEPNVLVYQCDLDVWRVDLRPIHGNVAARGKPPSLLHTARLARRLEGKGDCSILAGVFDLSNFEENAARSAFIVESCRSLAGN
jgi:hypothetical protein